MKNTPQPKQLVESPGLRLKSSAPIQMHPRRQAGLRYEQNFYLKNSSNAR